MRYKLIPPVAGGFGYWVINDMINDFTVAYFWKDLPNVANEARELFDKLNK